MKRHHRILVVEDDAELAGLYRASLRFAGFEVHTAHDGLSALQAIDTERPDLVVLDLHLPHVDGETVLQELSAMKDIPVIVVTGNDPGQAASGASAVLRKPCDPELLLTTIEHRLRAA